MSEDTMSNDDWKTLVELRMRQTAILERLEALLAAHDRDHGDHERRIRFLERAVTIAAGAVASLQFLAKFLT